PQARRMVERDGRDSLHPPRRVGARLDPGDGCDGCGVHRCLRNDLRRRHGPGAGGARGQSPARRGKHGKGRGVMRQALRPLLALMLAACAAGAMAAPDESGKGPRSVFIDRDRFGGKQPDAAFGAYQRGLYLTALKLALERAEAGDAAAQTLAGEIYSRGLGVRRDPEKAFQWYARAARQGDREALFQYGMALIDGTHVERNEEEAHEYLRRAA